jgi:pre-rRNA-processing protein IPI1
MDHCPDLVISGYLGPCLQHFCDLLSAAHRSRSVKAQSIKATNKVLHALCGFLRRGFPDAGAVAGDMVGSISRVTTTSTTSTLQHHLTLAHSRCVWPARHTASGLDPVTAALLKSGLQAPATTPGAATHPPPHTAAAAAGSMAPPSGQGVVHSSALRLLHLLFECWMECSPAELGSPDPEKVTALVAILTAANKVVAGVLGGVKEAGSSIAGVETLVDGILKRVVPYFPAAMPVVRPSPAVLDLLTQYNLQASQLLVSFLPLHKAAAAAVPDGAHTSASGKRGQGRGSSSGSMLGSVQWVAALVSFYVGVLEQGVLVLPMDVLAERSALSPGAAGGTATPATKAEDTPADAAAAAASAAYTSVLQGVASAVTVVPPDIQHRVLQAVTDLSTRLHARATTRATCLKLQHTLMRAWQKGRSALVLGQISWTCCQLHWHATAWTCVTNLVQARLPDLCR